MAVVNGSSDPALRREFGLEVKTSTPNVLSELVLLSHHRSQVSVRIGASRQLASQV